MSILITLLTYLPRKLNRTCKDSSRKKALEKRFSNLCQDVVEVVARDACNELFDADSLLDFGWNVTRVDTFEKMIFKYLRENVALLSIYIKDPYCVKIIQAVDFPA